MLQRMAEQSKENGTNLEYRQTMAKQPEIF